MKGDRKSVHLYKEYISTPHIVFFSAYFRYMLSVIVRYMKKLFSIWNDSFYLS